MCNDVKPSCVHTESSNPENILETKYDEQKDF